MSKFPISKFFRVLNNKSGNFSQLRLPVLLLTSLMAFAPALNAAMITVNSAADLQANNGACTLREALLNANSDDQSGATDCVAGAADDIIVFSGLFTTPQTILLQSALPDISASVTIQGPGANLLTVRRAPGAATDFRIFNTIGGLTISVSMSGVTVTGGNVNQGQSGGGINAATTLNLSQVHLTGNTAGLGGGLSAGFADVTLNNCTVSNNVSTNANGAGGGIFIVGIGGNAFRIINSTVSGNSAENAGGINLLGAGGQLNTLEIVNSTITNNTAVNAGGVRSFSANFAGANITLRNSIIAGNTPSNLASGSQGGGPATLQTLGFNLSENYNNGFALQASDLTGPAVLGPLQDNGGQTPTHAPLLESLALDNGNATGTDQRGLVRQVDLPGIANAAGGNGSDIGALEAQTTPPMSAIFRNGFEN
jgi:CSLREA domain-containing protein